MIIRHAHNSETSLQTAVRQKTSRESKLSRHNQSLGKVAVCVSAALCVDPHCTHTHTGQRQWSITTALTTRVHPNARLWCEWVKAPTDQTLCTDLDSHAAHTHTPPPPPPQQKRPSQTRLFRLPDPIFFPVSL